MLYHQPHILENMGTEELLIFTINEFIDEAILVIRLKANFLNNSPNEGMFRTANISLALLYVGKDNSLHKLLLYATFSFFIADLVLSNHIAEQYKVEQYV